MLHTDVFNISWQLGRFCNYSCSYCWPDCHSSIPDYKPVKVLIRTIDAIKEQARARNFNSFRLSLAGGEPSLQKGFLEFASHYSQDTENCNHQSLHVTTNLSRKTEWFRQLIEVLQPLDRVSFVASFHKEFANREEFADKVQFLLERGVYCKISLVMIPQKFDAVWKNADYFYNRRFINVALQTQTDSQGRTVPGYTKEMLNKLQKAFPFNHFYCNKGDWKSSSSSRKDILRKVKSSGFVELNDTEENSWYLDNCDRLNALNFNRYGGWECSAGYRSLVIDVNGFIKRGYSCHDSPIGHIDEKVSLLPALKPCVSPICSCTADNKIPKRKRKTKRPLFYCQK